MYLRGPSTLSGVPYNKPHTTTPSSAPRKDIHRECASLPLCRPRALATPTLPSPTPVPPFSPEKADTYNYLSNHPRTCPDAPRLIVTSCRRNRDCAGLPASIASRDPTSRAKPASRRIPCGPRHHRLAASHPRAHPLPPCPSTWKSTSSLCVMASLAHSASPPPAHTSADVSHRTSTAHTTTMPSTLPFTWRACP